MGLRPASTARCHVAVGESREGAARVFGPVLDSALVTSYAAFDTEVDLAEVATVGLVAGRGLDRVLDRLESDGTTVWPAGVRLGLPVDRQGREALRAALARRPAVAISAVVEHERGVVITLANAADVTAAVRERLLTQALGAPRRPEPATAPTRTAFARSSLMVRLAGLAGVLVAVLVATLVVIGHSSLGVDGVLVGLLVTVLLGQGALFLAVAYAVKLGRESRAAQHEQHEVLLNRTRTLIELTRNTATAHKNTVADVKRLEDQILALGRLTSRTRAEARERR